MAAEARPAGPLRQASFSLRSSLVFVATRLRALEGFRACALSLALGALAAAAMPPFFWWPLLALVFPALVWLLDGGAKKPLLRAGLIGFFFGFGFFLAGLYWVGFAFTVDAKTFAWMIPFVAVLLPGGLALFTALAFVAARALWSDGILRVLAFVFCFSLFEYLRGHVLSGFPWNFAGHAWAFMPAPMQSASLVGIYGLSLLTLLAASAPAAIVDAGGKVLSRALGARLMPASSLLILSLIWGFGVFRLDAAAVARVEGVRLRIVQPNIAQEDKYRPELRWANWRVLLDLTAREGIGTITHVIWPEAAPPFLLSQNAQALSEIARVLPKSTILLTGATRAEIGADKPLFYNGFVAVDSDGQIIASYDKFHLVPFGEYLPLESVLETFGLAKLIGLGAFAEGDGARTLSVPGTPPFSPLICYEIIFPGSVVESGTRPGWLLNVTDDSWFGDTTGPRQHLSMARLRAVEEGLPVVRAANTGISTIIDPYGNVGARLDYGTQGTIDASLPVALSPTLYSRFGDALYAALLLLCALGAGSGRWRARKANRVSSHVDTTSG